MLEITKDRFEELVARAIESLPAEYAKLTENVFVVVEEQPSREDLESVGMSAEDADELLGLYQGTPLEARDSFYSELPDRVVLYRRPILFGCDSEDEAYEEILDTLVHELGHHFGLDDDEMPY
jgi:predicted Zn-dependent protease with MMP-like domain